MTSNLMEPVFEEDVSNGDTIVTVNVFMYVETMTILPSISGTSEIEECWIERNAVSEASALSALTGLRVPALHCEPCKKKGNFQE